MEKSHIRCVHILLEREQPQGEIFVTAAAVALREYADALDRDAVFGGPHLERAGVFTASNGCVLRYAAGAYEGDQGSSEKPRSSTCARNASSTEAS